MAKWIVQTGKGKGAYSTLWTFDAESKGAEYRARTHYICLNTFGGHKKRLIDPSGKIVWRDLSQ